MIIDELTNRLDPSRARYLVNWGIEKGLIVPPHLAPKPAKPDRGAKSHAMRAQRVRDKLEADRSAAQVVNWFCDEVEKRANELHDRGQGMDAELAWPHALAEKRAEANTITPCPTE